MSEVDVLKSGHNAHNIFIVVIEVIHLSSAFIYLMSRFVSEERLRPRCDLIPVVEAEDRVDYDVTIFKAKVATLQYSILHIKASVNLTIDKVHAI